MCPNCAFEMKKLYKCADIDKIFANFKIEAEAVRVLSDISSSAYNTHLKPDHKTQSSKSRQVEQFIDQPIPNLLPIIEVK